MKVQIPSSDDSSAPTTRWGWRRAVCSVALGGFLGLSACESPRTPERLGGGGRIGEFDQQLDRGETAGINRPFGQRFVRFGELTEKELRKAREDIGKRMEILGEAVSSYRVQLGKEVERTTESVGYAPRAPFIDAGLHWDSLNSDLGRTVQRAKRDSYNFWERAWRTLKMLE